MFVFGLHALHLLVVVSGHRVESVESYLDLFLELDQRVVDLLVVVSFRQLVQGVEVLAWLRNVQEVLVHLRLVFLLVQLEDLVLQLLDAEVFALVLELQEVDILAIDLLVDEPLVAGQFGPTSGRPASRTCPLY